LKEELRAALKVEVLLSPLEPLRIFNSNQPTAIVAIDALRATTTMVTAFQCGVEAIIPVSSVEEARDLQEANPSWLLAGEVGGIAPEGFQLGNSPLEWLARSEELMGKTLIMSTTNGTRLLKRLQQETQHPQDILFIGALVNRSILCEEILQGPFATVLLCCAGHEGQVSLEDTACAGYLTQRLQGLSENPLLLGDGARIALGMAQEYPEPLDIFQQSTHSQTLISLGLQPDIQYASQFDLCTVAPILQHHQISLPASKQEAGTFT
jgi:2-phosphosulfolactate phosphatase